MSYKLKLGVAVAVAALALPSLAAAQDPSTRTDIVVIGATLSDGAEVADANATPAPDAPVVYEDDAAPNATDQAADEEAAAPSEAK
jgi:hypothetical protein